MLEADTLSPAKPPPMSCKDVLAMLEADNWYTRACPACGGECMEFNAITGESRHVGPCPPLTQIEPVPEAVADSPVPVKRDPESPRYLNPDDPCFTSGEEESDLWYVCCPRCGMGVVTQYIGAAQDPNVDDTCCICCDLEDDEMKREYEARPRREPARLGRVPRHSYMDSEEYTTQDFSLSCDSD